MLHRRGGRFNRDGKVPMSFVRIASTRREGAGAEAGHERAGQIVQPGRGANMITAMPARHSAAPSRSQRLGFTASTHHSQKIATVT